MQYNKAVFISNNAVYNDVNVSFRVLLSCTMSSWKNQSIRSISGKTAPNGFCNKFQ